ncbi:MAG: ADP-ribose pyrophosphatase [Anaerolineales bacterium]|nr:ADP-ribose pyrophosphatase [Anaerolineales bacterium]
MSLTPWKILESKYIRPRVRIDTVELPNGKTFQPMVFEYRRWATVFALTEQNEVVLIRQYRHGAQNIVWELPGGIVEDGEEVEAGARRELLEETGYDSSDLIEIGRVSPNPASHTNTVYAYFAGRAKFTQEQHLDEAEEIEVHLIPLDEVIAMAKRGEIPSALHVAVLFHALAHMNHIG